MFFPGRAKTIPNVPCDIREGVVMAIRIIEGKSGNNVELVGSQPKENGLVDLKYRTKKFTDPEEIERQREEIENWVQTNPELLQKGLLFLKNTIEPVIKMAQKMGIGPKVS